jgi:hypothetical protein
MATRATASGRQRLAMEPDATTNARIAALHEEITSIHFVTKLFWEQKAHSSEARAEHYRRQDRLEEIRSELAALTGVRDRGPEYKGLFFCISGAIP